MSERMPSFLNDLYADLRDRRLLLPAGLLILGILAIPMLMKSQATAPPPASAPAAELAGDDLSAVPAVLAASPELRDYRERLEKLNSKNPFQERFAPAEDAIPEPADVTVVTPDDIAGLPAQTLPDGGGTSSAPPPSTEPAPVSPAPKPAPAPASDDAGSDGASKPAPSPVTKEVEVAYRADLRVGRDGDLARHKNTKLLTVLPSHSKPVLIFLGVTETGKEAVFMVSSDVEQAQGSGSCMPAADDCQFLTLKAGERATLDYAPGESSETYAVHLLDINRVPVKETKSSDADGEQSSSTQDDLAAWLGL